MIFNFDFDFQHIPVWMSEAKKHIEPHKAVFILVGTKYDLTQRGQLGEREVGYEEGRSLADTHGIPFLETSAKTGLNVEETFVRLTQEVYDKIRTGDYR